LPARASDCGEAAACGFYGGDAVDGVGEVVFGVCSLDGGLVNNARSFVWIQQELAYDVFRTCRCTIIESNLGTIVCGEIEILRRTSGDGDQVRADRVSVAR